MISPDENFLISAFCSDCFSPVVFPFPCCLTACPTKFSALTFCSLFSSSDIFLTVSRNWAKIIILEFRSCWNWFWTSFFSLSSLGCSLFRVVVSENARVNSSVVVSFFTAFDLFSAAWE